MEIRYGVEVMDRNGKVLGKVDHLMHNSWTGIITKFAVRRKAPNRDLLFSTEDVLEATNTKVKLKISFHELRGRHNS